MSVDMLLKFQRGLATSFRAELTLAAAMLPPAGGTAPGPASQEFPTHNYPSLLDTLRCGLTGQDGRPMRVQREVVAGVDAWSTCSVQ